MSTGDWELWWSSKSAGQEERINKESGEKGLSSALAVEREPCMPDLPNTSSSVDSEVFSDYISGFLCACDDIFRNGNVTDLMEQYDCYQYRIGPVSTCTKWFRG
jgi:hypothetical protein